MCVEVRVDTDDKVKAAAGLTKTRPFVKGGVEPTRPIDNNKSVHRILSI